uniref:Uncharacterized protein n=1 Tax=Glossina pallidipes TaxID=7398 RepID=A0A1A9ZAP2_GLOPL
MAWFIDYSYLVKEHSYSADLQLGSKGVNYATNIIQEMAMKPFECGLRVCNRQQRVVKLSQSDGAIYTNKRNVPDNRIDAIGQQFYKKEWMHSLNGDNNTRLSETKSAADPKLNGAARVRELPLRKAKVRNAQDNSKCSGTSTTEAEDKCDGSLMGALDRGYNCMNDLSEIDMQRPECCASQLSHHIVVELQLLSTLLGAVSRCVFKSVSSIHSSKFTFNILW